MLVADVELVRVLALVALEALEADEADVVAVALADVEAGVVTVTVLVCDPQAAASAVTATAPAAVMSALMPLMSRRSLLVGGRYRHDHGQPPPGSSAAGALVACWRSGVA